MDNTQKIMALGDKSCSARSAAGAPPPKLLNDILRPSSIGLSSIKSVQTAAIPMVPAPIKRTFSFHSFIANAAISISAGCGMCDEKYGTAMPQAIEMPNRMAIPPVSPTK